MSFSRIFNPFRREKIDDYPGVLVPLTSRRSDVSTSGSAQQSGDSEDVEKKSLGSVSVYTVESLRREIREDVVASEYADTAYDLKSKVINKAIQDIGMGRYNWELFVLCGFGWFVDSLWLSGVSLTLSSLSAEFGISEKVVRYTTASVFAGLCVGSCFWGISCDVLGRKFAFNTTLLLTAVFGLAAGGASNWIAVCGLLAASGIGVGGNLPVDGALFLEFLPMDNSSMLTYLSAWWPIGTVVASFIAWGFLSDSYPVDEGWRYFVYTMAAIIGFGFLCRFLLFHLFESPKYLLSRGRQAEAVAVVHGMAYRNKATTWLTEEILNEIGGEADFTPIVPLSIETMIKRRLSSFSTRRIKPLFHTKRLGTTTALLWFSWLAIGMAYTMFYAFLPQYLAQGHGKAREPISHYETYRNLVIASVVGFPGAIVAGVLVEVPHIGRKGTMAVATLCSGICLFLFTISANSIYQLAFSSLESFFANAMLGTLYAYTPEVFPAPNRGTGAGIASCLNRVAGLCAPIIAANIPGGNANAPVFVSGALVLAAFVAICFLPIETRGKQML